jgi:quercetin dioxygenase-like cupin family protein
MKANLTYKAIGILLLQLTFSGDLFAQHPASAPITDTMILKVLVNTPGISNKDVQMEVVTFSPGSSSSAHRHPCPTFGYLLEGEIESVFEGAHHVYKKGDSFYEKPYGLHSVTRNNDPSKPARLLVFYLSDPSKPTSIHLKK